MWLLSRSVCRGCDQSEQSYCRVTCLYHVTRVVTGFTVTSLIHGLCDLLHFDWLLPWQTESLHGRNAVSWDAVNCNVMSLQWAEIVDMMSEPLAGATAVAVWVCWRPTLIQPMSHDSIWLHQSCLQSDRQSSVSHAVTVCLLYVSVCPAYWLPAAGCQMWRMWSPGTWHGLYVSVFVRLFCVEIIKSFLYYWEHRNYVDYCI